MDTYDIRCSQKLAEELEVDKQLAEHLLRDLRLRIVLLEVGSQMQYLVHDDEKVV